MSCVICGKPTDGGTYAGFPCCLDCYMHRPDDVLAYEQALKNRPEPGSEHMRRPVSDSLVTIYTDGACSGNPGPGGWAAVLSTGQRRKEVAGRKPHTTNNEMELAAVCEALKALKRSGLSVAIYTDSMLVINLLANGHQTKKSHLAVLVREIKELVVAKNLRCDRFHVNGHSGDPGNERANALARIEARKAKRM